MTDATTEPAPSTETPPGAIAQPGAEAGTKPERPDWLGDDPHGFWDGDAGAVRADAMYKSYGELKSAFGKRVHDLSPEARKALVAAVPEDTRAAWAKEERERLAQDEEFLAPLRDSWLADKLPKAPEAYVAPAELPIDMEHPAAKGLMEVAKAHGLSQDAFAQLARMGLDLVAPYEAEPSMETLTSAIGADLAPRAMAVGNRMRSLLGPEQGNALLRTMRHPDQFLALERLVQASSEKPLPLDGGERPSQWTEASLKAAVMDERYLPGPKHDPAFYAQVKAGFQQAYPSDRV